MLQIPKFNPEQHTAENQLEHGYSILQRGIVLKPRQFSRNLMHQALAGVRKPQPPMVFVEDLGQHVENEHDPEYRAAMLEWATTTTDAAYRVLYAMGTAVEHLPDGVWGPEDDGWINEIAFALVDVPEYKTPAERYLAWLDLYALIDEQDHAAAFVTGIFGMGGTLEASVAQAITFFRDHAEQSAADGVRAFLHSVDGDRVPEPDRGEAPEPGETSPVGGGGS